MTALEYCFQEFIAVFLRPDVPNSGNLKQLCNGAGATHRNLG